MEFLNVHGLSEQGPVRTSNEDCFGVDAERGLCIVADGMGGHNGGEVASRIAVDGVKAFIRSSGQERYWPYGFDHTISNAANLLRTAVHVANGMILEAAAGQPTLAGMGTTIVAGLLDRDTLAVVHVGDSRLYLLRAAGLRLLTEDDSWALNRNVLTNVLGARREVLVHVAEEKVAGGDLVILVTDGIHAVLDDDGIAELVRQDGEPSAIADRLVRAALAHGSRDNCTALVGRVGEAPAGRTDL
jgi:protein phosphatase